MVPSRMLHRDQSGVEPNHGGHVLGFRNPFSRCILADEASDILLKCSTVRKKECGEPETGNVDVLPKNR